jgi:serine/threonine-protein kinase
VSTDYPSSGAIIDGKYRIERILGQGAMGVVLAATHLELGQSVAIKLLQSHYAEQSDAAARFIREARACVRIQSEHVVRVLDVGRFSSGSPYMVMEYLEGRDFSQVLIKDGPLSIPLAVEYILQTCDAVAAAHARGIIHRDLKPSNLFLVSLADGTQAVKVIDFGISKVRVGDSADGGAITQGTLLGSPVYMSPEQMMSREIDARSDIWAIGVILYELLTGQPPFNAETIPQLCSQVLHAPAVGAKLLRAETPLMVEAIIHRCLEKEPRHRFANVGELAMHLADFGPPAVARLAARAARFFAGPSAS